MKILNPIFTLDEPQSNFMQPSNNRARTLFQPIHPKNSQNSRLTDYVKFLVTPLYDYFFSPLFLIDAAIHLLNGVGQVANALYLFTVDEMTDSSAEMTGALEELKDAVTCFTAAHLNIIFSIASLISRPICSMFSTCNDMINHASKAPPSYDDANQNTPVYA